MAEFRHVLRLKTARFVSTLEDWLDRNSEGGYAIRLEDISDDMDTRRYLIYFEFPSDLAVFKWAMTQRGMPDRPDPPRRGGSDAGHGASAA